MQDNRPESIEGLTQTDLDRLMAENAKWRERVPRLAAALQTRTQELDQLNKSLEVTSSTTGGARQALIEETQAQLEEAKQRYRKSEGDLKSCEVQIEDLSGEVTSWKGKWSELANSLDERDKALFEVKSKQQESESECISLRTRNEDVLQTAEMAHQEIEVLTEDVSRIQTLLADKGSQLEDLKTNCREQQSLIQCKTEESTEQLKALELAEAAVEEVGLQLAESRETLAKREQRVEDLDRNLQEQEAMLSRFRSAADAAESREQQLAVEIRDGSESKEKVSLLEIQLQELSDEKAHLKNTLANVQDSEKALSEEINSLAESRQELQSDYREVVRDKNRTTESLNVLTVEAESRGAMVADLELRLKAKAQQVSELKEELQRAETEAPEPQSHVQLVSDLETSAAEVMLREKDNLIEELEKHNQAVDEKNQRCLVAIESERDNFARRVEDLENLLLEVETENSELGAKLTSMDQLNPEEQPKVDRLMSDIRRLEESLRVRTKDMNDTEWKNSVDTNKQDQTMLILNQQLQDARDENRRLVERLNKTSLKTIEQPVRRQTTAADDLTQIKGIGPKLASQLNELGVYSIEQLAELDAVEIEDDHLLHPFKSRMYRDNWVGQALQITS